MLDRADTKLRDYQTTLIDETVEALRQHRSVLLQSPTGAGKTEMAVEIARRHRDQRVWFVCHRHEIVAQTSGALKRAGVDAHGVVAPRHPEDPTIRIQVCSIGALRHRLKRYPPPGLIVLDECHHVAASSWAKLIKRFPDAKLLGLTATPERLDGRGLDGWFQHMIVGPDTRALIAEGYLSKFRIFAPTIPDLRGVRVKQKEYDRHELEVAMNKQSLVGDVVDHFKEKLAPTARALAFCASVTASRDLAARFKAAGIPAKYIGWNTPRAERDRAVRELASGKLRVLTNVEVFTEGFDLPAIDAVLLLRPTKSFGLYRQMVGRCLRVAPGKRRTVILDHAGVAYEHGLPDDDVEWTLTGRRSDVAKGSPHGGGFMRRCPECYAVHKWSAKCLECGYVYQIRDRTIEEVYGELREIRQGAVYESQARFARRCKLSTSTIWTYVKQKQMIAYGPRRLIKISEGLAHVEWLRENNAAGSYNAPPFGADSTKYETQGAFAKRVGTTTHGIQELTKSGLPKAKNGWVYIEGGLAWLRREGRLTKDGMYINQRPQSTPGFDSRLGFAKRLGVNNKGAINRLIDEGLPINERRLIPVDAAIQWLRREGLLDKDDMHIPRSTPGFDNRTSFRKRLGVSKTTIASLIKEGLPNERGLIPVEDGLEWLKRKGLLTKDGEYTRKQHAIPDEQIKHAMVMRRQGYTWKMIGEHFGVRASSMFNAVKQRGVKLPDNDALEGQQG
jgi:superfamily II DNA or RNA helicase